MEIIIQCHNHVLARHPGIKKMKELVLREYWWPKLKNVTIFPYLISVPI